MIKKRSVVMDFTGGSLSSDAGLPFLRQVDDRLELTERLSSCLSDDRDPVKVRHRVIDQLRQRIYQICCGYSDANDADTLRSDPSLKVAVGREPKTGSDLASQPTLSRFENSVGRKELARCNRQILSTYLSHRPCPSRVIVLDIDATDDPTYGQQELSFYHGFYEQHMFHPLLCYDGETGDLLAAMLRPGNVHAANGVVKMLKRIVRKIRKRWPWVAIIIRADAGFSVPRLYRFCEQHRLSYVVGLITNRVLERLHAPLLSEAEKLYASSGKKARLVGEVGYRAGSWMRYRRVIMKAEVMPQGINRRFVVTNLDGDPKKLYDFYIQRGQAENWIKDLKNGLLADRLSCSRFLANSFRLLLHTAAYLLMHNLRRQLAGTELATAQFDTIRLRLLKVGARVRQTCRKVWIHAPSSFPHRPLWVLLHHRLAQPAPT
jgi:hypothetical protein